MTYVLYFILVLIAIVAAILLSRRKEHIGAGSADSSVAWQQALQEQLDTAKRDLNEAEREIRDLTAQLAVKEEQLKQLTTKQQDIEAVEIRMRTEFENLSSKLLEQRGEQLNLSNARQMGLILQPLREKIKEFEENIDRKFTEEIREKSGLKKEIEQLRDLNQQLSQDANNLASALKGQNKTQGDWGEAQLEVLLEKAGLQKGIHFITQTTYRDEEGSAKRPDFIIQLPQNKQLIIDAKVSLTAFERFHNDPDPLQKGKHLKAHIESIRSHIDNLSSKNYQQLADLETPDYLLLFIPLESALTTATQADSRLFGDAMDKNIVLVTTSSLLTTMRTVSHLWKQEKQSRSVQEIARQSGLLYDKFVAFVEDLRAIGSRLDQAHQSYDDAMNKLTSATRPGDTLIGKAEKIRELGAKATKSLPQELREE